MSVAHIGKLQENTAALREKYLKMSVAHIGKLQENTVALCKMGCETLRVSAIRVSAYVYPEKLKHHPLPSGAWFSDVRHPDGMATAAEFRMWYIRVESGGSRMEFLLEWNVAAAEWNSYPGGMCRIPHFLYSGFAYGFQRTLLNLGLLWW